MADNNQDDKARLTDVLGALVSGVAHARSVADSEVMNIARMYRRHEYLRGLTVPRLRVNKVVIELPVLLDRVLPAESARLNSPEKVATLASKALRNAAGDLLKYIDTTSHKMTPEVAERAKTLMQMFQSDTRGVLKQFGTAIIERMRTLKERLEGGAAEEMTITAPVLRDEIGDATERILRNMFAQNLAEKARADHERKHAQTRGLPDDLALSFSVEDEILEPVTTKWTKAMEEQVINETLFDGAITELLAHVRGEAERAAILRTTRPADFEVRVNTEDIKNAGRPGAVTRVRMVLSEEGLEWTEDQREDGTSQWKLNPE
jgi:hypothetical protein